MEVSAKTTTAFEQQHCLSEPRYPKPPSEPSCFYIARQHTP